MSLILERTGNVRARKTGGEKYKVFVTEVPVKRYGSAYGKKRRNKMEVVEVKLRDEYIKLGQALKAAHVVGSGVDAKFLIQDGKVTVNGQVELQRGKKLHAGDEATCGNFRIKIV